MKSAGRTLTVKRGFFGSPKPLHKQSFVDDIRKLVLEICKSEECPDNLMARRIIHEAGDVAIALITGIWENPCKMNEVGHALNVDFKFNNDYTDWLVNVEYASFPYLRVFHEHSPNYAKAIEAERKELFERYGFKDEVDSRIWMVEYHGKHAEMTSDELNKFRKEFGFNSDLIVKEKPQDA